MILTVSLNPAVDRAYRVEGLAPGSIHAVAEHTVAAGGKANNVARTLAILGVPVLATGLAGGNAGRFLVADLDRRGIATAFLPVAAETRTCVAVADAQGKVTSLREPGPPVPPAACNALLDQIGRLLPGVRLAVVAGSLPPGAPADFFARAVALARVAGVPAILDTSGPSLAAAVAEGPDVVKPNLEELAAWAGQPLPDRAARLAAARALVGAGARNVVVSLGREGALAVSPEGCLQARAPAVRPLNPVGSGDCLVAGLAAALVRGQDLAEALRLGVACGSANAMTLGVAAPDLDTIRCLAPRVQVNQVSAATSPA